jgi:hypothetical protein
MQEGHDTVAEHQDRCEAKVMGQPKMQAPEAPPGEGGECWNKGGTETSAHWSYRRSLPRHPRVPRRPPSSGVMVTLRYTENRQSQHGPSAVATVVLFPAQMAINDV